MDGMRPKTTQISNARIAVLPNMRGEDPIHTTPSWNKFKITATMPVSKRQLQKKLRGGIVEKASRIYVRRTRADVQTQIKEALVDIWEPGGIVATLEVSCYLHGFWIRPW